MKKAYTLLSLIICAFCVKAQIPNTEIYLLDLDNHGSHTHAGKPKNISNNKGYDSQPSFSKEGGSILFSSIRNGTQADVFEYQVAQGQVVQVTHTDVSEYSPTFMDDGTHFSVVMVESDSAQRLWKFKYRSDEKPERILDKAVDSVGYHCWYTQGRLALFVLTQPISLQLAEVGNWETKTVAEKVGRCMLKVPREEAFYFVDKSDSLNYFICKYTNGTIEKLFNTYAGSEDFCITPEGNFIMAKESTIYMLSPATKTWAPLADLKNEGIAGITRVAISPDGKRLAIVAKEN